MAITSSRPTNLCGVEGASMTDDRCYLCLITGIERKGTIWSILPPHEQLPMCKECHESAPPVEGEHRIERSND